MTQELKLKRKWTFRAHGAQMIFVKKSYESDIHVFSKALLWALFLPAYPDLSVEIHIGNRYKPDLVKLDGNRKPVFWGEAGRVSQRKMQALLNRFRSTHMAFAKWNMNLEPFQKIIKKETAPIRRSAPVELISFPAESDKRFIDCNGNIGIAFKDVQMVRF